jgi:predicted MPP superfamily phosphohydrolase
MFSRRAFLRGLGSSAALAAGASFYTWRIEPHRLEIVRRPLEVAGLPEALAGRTLAQLSDLHVGLQVDDDYLLDTFARVATLAPDLVVVTGDLISHHAGSSEQVAALFRRFPHGALGTLAVLGNHDYGPGWADATVAERLTAQLERFGLVVLRNQTFDVAGLRILGLDDLWAGRFAPELLADALADGAPAIALSHNPDTVDRAGWGDFSGWILAGHTHGGQCKPPFLPPPLLPVANRRYTAGEFALTGGRRLYVNRGVGHLTRVRFNVRPEVTLFELRPEAG